MTQPTLYLCEKRSQAEKIARALGNTRNRKGYMETAAGTVTYARGHLFEDLRPDDYRDDWGTPWRLEVLPMVPDAFRDRPRDRAAAAQYRVIEGLLARAGEVVIATDPDREGEAIARDILAHADYKGPLRRLWLRGEDMASIRKALDALRPGSETEALYRAAKARAYADLLVGINLTRAVTLTVGAGGKGALHVGRVQTPALWMVIERDRQIEAFVPEPFYELEAHLKTTGGIDLDLVHAPAAEARIKDREAAARLAEQAKGASEPLAVETEEKRQAPPLPFNLPDLQKEANKKWSWSAKKTLDTAQALYTKGLTTYPRTAVRHLATDQRDEVEATLAHLKACEPLAELITGFTPVIRDTTFDSAKAGAHTGLCPTLQPADLDALGSDERKLYLLIARRYVAALMPDYEYLRTVITWTVDGTEFKRIGTTPRNRGWKAAWRVDDGDGTETLPPVKGGDMATAEAIEVIDKQTQPPRPYTVASWLADMEGAAKFAKDPRIRGILHRKEQKGIGTSATRDQIQEALIGRGYVTLDKREVRSTPKGRNLIEAMEKTVPRVIDPAETAVWEDTLDQIAEGKGDADAFIAAIVDALEENVRSLHQLGGAAKADGAPGDRHRKRHRDKAPAKPAAVLDVPYDEREEAKALGARWDAANKCWYVPQGTDPAPFAKWQPTEADRIDRNKSSI